MTFTQGPCVKGQTRTHWILVVRTQNSAHIAMFKEKEFICIEQGYMYNRAVINGAPVAAQQISCITDPHEIGISHH